MSSRLTEKHSFRLGANLALCVWAVSSSLSMLAHGGWSVYLVVSLAAVVVCAWLIDRDVAALKRRAESTRWAHIAPAGAFAALRCSRCNAHLAIIEKDHDLAQLDSIRDGHQCKPAVPAGGDAA